MMEAIRPLTCWFLPGIGSFAVLAWLVITAVILLAATTVALNADHMPDNDQKPRERDEDESRQEAADVRLAA